MIVSFNRAVALFGLLIVFAGLFAGDLAAQEGPVGEQAPWIIRHPQAVSRERCFPLETLPEDSRALSEELLLEALDSEALYTLIGDIKPVSEGFFDTWFNVEPADPSELSRVRTALTAWQCGGHYETGVLPFQHLRGGRRFASAWIASRPGLEEKIDEQAEYFGRLGMGRDSTAEALLLRIEGADDPEDRWRGFGLVFGYPQRAVDFFVLAGSHYSTTGEFVERDFRNYPTHASATGGFVYAVPKLEAESGDETLLRRKVEAILTSYRALREKYIVGDKPDRVVDLLRDWFDDGTGWCHPDHAMQKAMDWNEARLWVESSAVSLETVLPDASLEDLDQLNAVLIHPRIVALGESTHGTREFFLLKHRLFRYMVENHGVRLFGIESSYAACLPINDYVLHGKGDPRKAVRGQGFWTWDTEEVLALVEWMRRWNRNRAPGSPPLQFYGFDTQDAYTPLSILMEMLQEVAPEITADYQNRLSLALDEQYSQSLNSATIDELDDLLTAIEDLRSDFGRFEEGSLADRNRVQLLFQQAAAAIQNNVSRLQRWSSIGMLKEIELYSRIRTNLPEAVSTIAAMDGKHSAALIELVREAGDLTRCQLRFRDELSEREREVWRNAAQWGIETTDSPELGKLLLDLKLFLEVSTEYIDKPKILTNARDESMAGFVSSILEMHGPESRIVLWAHDWHVSRFDGNPIEDVPRMGTYLHRDFGDQYMPVGLSFGSGGFQSKYYPGDDEDPAMLVLREFELEGSRSDSFSNVFNYNDAPVSAYLLNGQSAKQLPRWFGRQHANRTIGAAYQPDLENSDSYYEPMVLPEHFAMVFHVRETERARPLSPVARFRLGAVIDKSAGVNENSLEPQSGGVRVKAVSAGSLAERCGILAGDRITRIGATEISGVDEFERRLAAIETPGSLEMTVIRAGESNNGESVTQDLRLYLIVPPWIVD